MNIRVVRRDRNFTQIDNALLEDSTISFQAKGMLCYLLSKTDSWKAITGHLVKVGPDKLHSVRSTMKELIENGYAKRMRKTDKFTHRVIVWEFVVFENKAEGAAYVESEEATMRKPDSGPLEPESGFPEVGNQPLRNTIEIRKTLCSQKDSVTSVTLSAAAAAACDSGLVSEAETGAGISDQEAQAMADESEREEAPAAPISPEPAPLLTSEDDPGEKTFPWRQMMAAMKRIVPELTLPNKGDRRDQVMKNFWRTRGKTVGAFEMLAEKVQASDYLMARGGHSGQHGRPYPWSWIFARNAKGVLRADEIMNGGYSSEAMAFAIGKKPQAKLTQGMDVMNQLIEVDLLEKNESGAPRWKQYGEHQNGLPIFIRQD